MSSDIIYNWLVYCIEENLDVSLWSSTTPTQCPNIHEDRSIDTSRTRIVGSRNLRRNFFKVYPETSKISSSTYTVVATFQYGGSNSIGTIYSIEAIALTENNTSTFDIRIYNPSASSIIAEKTGLNNNISDIIDLGTISNIPTDKTALEVQLRRTGGNGSTKINIKEIVVYYGPALT